MTEQERIERAEREADRLAALAAEPPIAVGAADREVGPLVLADHLPAELAVCHALMMQLAAVGGAVLDWPAGPADGRPYREFAAAASPEVDTTPAALAAARLAGAACRMMAEVCQGLPALAANDGAASGAGAVPNPGDGYLQAYGWANDLCPPEELERRFEVARAALAEDRPEAKLSAGGRAARDAARAAALALAAEAEAADLAVAIAARGDFRRRLLSHELAAGHGLLMRLASRFRPALLRAAELRREPVAALRLARAVARMAAHLRRGRVVFARLAPSGPGNATPTGGGRKPVALPIWAGNFGYNPPGPESVPSAAPSLPSPAPSGAGEGGERLRAGGGNAVLAWNRSLAPARRGRLNNDNPAGDFLRATRCGARTRRGACCLQPAMKNGRCRLHGGKSTGPRTAQGRARAASARLRHGAYRAEVVALQRAASQHLRRMKGLFVAHPLPTLPHFSVGEGSERQRAGGGASPAGHGVHPKDFSPAAGATVGAARNVDSPRSRFYCATAKKGVSGCPPRAVLAPTPLGQKYNF